MKDPNLVRKEILDVADILKMVVFSSRDMSASAHPESLKLIAGDLINMTSLKLQTFKANGIRCNICGCKGSYFAKEKYPDEPHYHLNLYALKDGAEILMTKDHIVPVAKGGRDRLNNFQTLCVFCNRKKAEKTPDKVKKKKLKPKTKPAMQR